MTRLGVVDSWSQWSVENLSNSSKDGTTTIWSFEGVGAAHICPELCLWQLFGIGI